MDYGVIEPSESICMAKTKPPQSIQVSCRGPLHVERVKENYNRQTGLKYKNKKKVTSLELIPDQYHFGHPSNTSPTVDEEPNAESIEDAHMKKEREHHQTTESMSAQSETTELDIYYCCIKCNQLVFVGQCK